MHPFLLQDHGEWVNHKKVLRLMRAMNLRYRIHCKPLYNSLPPYGEESRKIGYND
ncbi:IS3 family transposase [Paenibacillus puerhi]|uniref:IS3 family transposase n=1 Tax=Paenibacillus puerhi TaxID=2692622 RepID=UPI0038B267F3